MQRSLKIDLQRCSSFHNRKPYSTVCIIKLLQATTAGITRVLTIAEEFFFLHFYPRHTSQYNRCKAKALSLYIDKTLKFRTIEIYLEKECKRPKNTFLMSVSPYFDWKTGQLYYLGSHKTRVFFPRILFCGVFCLLNLNGIESRIT